MISHDAGSDGCGRGACSRTSRRRRRILEFVRSVAARCDARSESRHCHCHRRHLGRYRSGTVLTPAPAPHGARTVFSCAVKGKVYEILGTFVGRTLDELYLFCMCGSCWNKGIKETVKIHYLYLYNIKTCARGSRKKSFFHFFVPIYNITYGMINFIISHTSTRSKGFGCTFGGRTLPQFPLSSAIYPPNS